MKLLHELRRRRLFRLAGLYVVGAWVVIEVASVLFPAWGIPDTALRYLVIGATVLFPVAMIFGWLFDITSEGIVRTRPATPGEQADFALGRTDYVILAALAAVAVIVALGSLEMIGQEVEAPHEDLPQKPEHSVAILPLIADSDEQQVYADGISEDIIHRLAGIPPLRVMARTSSFAFRNSERPPQAVADVMGVRYLLQGTVHGDGQQLELRVELTDDAGFQVWSDTLTSSMNDIAALPDRIAAMVSRHVAGGAQVPEQRPGATTNAAAYRHYLVGKAYANTRPPNWAEEGEAAFRRAIAEDPDYALAHAGLAVALHIGSGEGDRLERKQRAIDRAAHAYALDPGQSMVQAVMGLVLLDGDESAVAEAVGYLQTAIELDPSDSNAYNWLASALHQLGRRDEAERVREQGLAVDPFNPPLVTNVANVIAAKGDFDRAMRVRMRLLDLPEPSGVGLWGIYMQYERYGNYAEAIHWAKQTALAYQGTRNQLALFSISAAYARLGLDAEADYWMAELAEHHPDRTGTLLRMGYLAKLRGDTDTLIAAANGLRAMGLPPSRLPVFLRQRIGAILVTAGFFDAGVPYLESALDIDTPLSQLTILQETAEMHYVLGHALAEQGFLERSAQVIERAHDMVRRLRADNLETNAPRELELLFVHHLFRGDLDSARIALGNAIDAGWANYYWMANDAFVQSFLSDPELARLFEDALRRVEEQRQIVVARDANDDFKTRFDALMN